MTYRTLLPFLIGVLVMSFGVAAPHVEAASLSLTSTATTVTAGDVVRVRVAVNAGGEAINTAEAVLQFPADILDVISLDKSSSIFSIWVDEPSFSNSQGTVSFSGGLPSPGYTGSSGTVVTVTFHARRAGVASLSLSGATVRANDGLGTNVLRGASGMTLQVVEAQKAPVPTTPVTAPEPVTTTKKPTSTADTTAPSISAPTFIYDIARGVLTVSAVTKDTDSGIEGYGIIIDGASPIHVPVEKLVKGAYEVPVHTSGEHAVTLQVSDKAGNRAQVSGTFTVPVIAPPTLTAVPEHMTKGDQLVLHGVAGADNALVRIYIAKNASDPTVFTVTPSSSGAFDFIGPVLQNGVYTVWAEGASVGGIVSAPTAHTDIQVTSESVFTVGGFGVSFPLLLIVMLLLTAGSCAAAGLAWYRLYTYHTRRGHLTPTAGKNIHRALDIFRDEMESGLDTLESAKSKRELTEDEMNLRAEMRANLVVLEKYIEKELK